MAKAQIITSPSGDELVVLRRRDYEDLVDALAADTVEAALASVPKKTNARATKE
jgi:hypothetical protein